VRARDIATRQHGGQGLSAAEEPLLFAVQG
jgi:hypothetical protein